MIFSLNPVLGCLEGTDHFVIQFSAKRVGNEHSAMLGFL